MSKKIEKYYLNNNKITLSMNSGHPHLWMSKFNIHNPRIIWYSIDHYLWDMCVYIMVWIVWKNGCVSLSSSSDKNWNLLESEREGLVLVRAIKETNVCDLSASRECDSVTLLHVAAARGYFNMLRELLELQVKLEENLYAFILGRSRGSLILV